MFRFIAYSQSLAMPHTGMLVLGVIANWEIYEGATLGPFIHPILRGIRAAAHDHACHLAMSCGINTTSGPDTTHPAWPFPGPNVDFTPVGPWNTDGLIAIAPLLLDRSQHVQMMYAQGHPVVTTSVTSFVPGVTVDNMHGIQLAFNHLIAHGHRNIAFVAGHDSGDTDSDERLAAYYSCLAQHQLPRNDQLVTHGFHNRKASYLAMQQLLRHHSFTAMIASNDLSAIGAMDALAEAGLRVPTDVAVVGFDNAISARASVPALTTVRHPIFEVGYQAVVLLLDYIAGRRTHANIVRIPVQLVTRESCGCQLVAASKLIPQPLASGDQQTLFAQRMIQTILFDAVRLDQRVVAALVQRLIDGFLLSLATGELQSFNDGFATALAHLTTVGESPLLLSNAIDMLRELPVLHQQTPLHYVQGMQRLDEAKMMLDAQTKSYVAQQIVQREETTDAVGLMTARLLAALDVEQILAVLREGLPRIGIRQALLAFYVGEDDDAFAWSEICAVFGTAHMPANSRFRTRQFPPPAVFVSDTPWSLAVLPLLIDGCAEGFVVFDSASLDLCGLLVHHIAAAFRTSRLYQAAQQGQRQAEEANRLKSRFLSTVSHELRTPLALLVGLSDMLLRQHQRAGIIDAETLRLDLERINASSQLLNLLIGDVLDLVSSEAGQLRLFFEPLDLVDVLQVVWITGEQMARAKNLRWTINIVPVPLVWGDRTRLRQIILNLVSNAVKFTDIGGVHLAVTCDEQHIQLVVEDTGIGIAPAEQAHVFDEFYRAEQARRHDRAGLGLGLAICRQLVELHDGAISVRSTGVAGEGTRMCVTLPVSATTAVPYTITEPRHLPPHSQHMSDIDLLSTTALAPDDPVVSRKTVLIVDDDVGLRELHARLIAEQVPGVRLLLAENGVVALALVEQTVPDLILLDLRMPELDGFAVLAALRVNSNTRLVPVVVLTAQVLTEAEMARLNAGVSTVIEKGVLTTSETLRQITAALNQGGHLVDAAQRLVRKVVLYVHEHYAEVIERAQVAAAFGVHEDYLTQCFQRVYGISLVTYINRFRIKQARELLEQTTLSVTQIALAVGFTDSSYFGRVFQRENGVPPRTYRRGLRAEQ